MLIKLIKSFIIIYDLKKKNNNNKYKYKITYKFIFIMYNFLVNFFKFKILNFTISL